MTDQDLERIKKILVGDLQESLDSVDARFEPDAFSKRVSDVVAEALAARVARDDKISDVLAPTIDQAISSSIDQDPKKLAESLYPIMGPAIRKSISETLQQMLENFNQILEESLSPKSLRWRFDAWRTGQSYSEFVMLNNLEYRIEQIFLIHRETSLLIQHQVADLADAKDPDMVSGMFSAIQDFIEDSFSTDATNELNTLRLGDLTVVIQRGPSAVLAAVVRGRVPENLRSDMVELLESLHIRKRTQLSDYSGDPDDFIDLEPDVRRLLLSERKPEKKKSFPWLAVVSIVVIAIAFGYWQWLGIEIKNQQTHLVAEIAGEPGIIILDKTYSRKAARVALLVDPDAIDVSTLTQEKDWDFEFNVISTPFLSLDPEILLRRASRILAPTSDTTLKVKDRIIYPGGVATRSWLEKAMLKWPGVVGAEGLNIEGLIVTDPEREALDALDNTIESFSFEFERGKAELDPDTAQFAALVTNVKSMLEQAQVLGIKVHIDIVGFTDETGTDRINRILSFQRAEILKQHMVASGIPADLLSTHRSEDYEALFDTIGRETRLIVSLEDTPR